jgi:hypothetical protein
MSNYVNYETVNKKLILFFIFEWNGMEFSNKIYISLCDFRRIYLALIMY